MIVRHANAGDDATLDRLLDNNSGGNVRLGVDELIVTGEHPTGLIVYRPVAFVHELVCGRDFLSRKRAMLLADAAVRDGIARYKLQGAIFIVRPDNKAMIRFLEQFGFIKQTDPGDLVYLWSRNGR